MSGDDQFLQAIEAVYASGLDSERLPEALESTSSLLGSVGACFEIIDKSTRQHRMFCAAGAPTVGRDTYLAEFAVNNPRIPFGLRQPVGSVLWDHLILDEAGMARDAFYSEFLPHFGLRYFMATVLEQSTETLAAVSVQRTRKQGHVGKREIALMRRLSPHYQRAHDVATRLRTAGARGGVLENALEWLADGVALLHADGDIVYANDTFRVLAQRGDAFRIAGRTIEFATHGARRLFEAALGAVKKIGDPSDDGLPTDFPVPRRDGMPAYIVSVRPLLRGKARETQAQADVMLLMRDPLWRNAATSQMLQRLFNLTNAEAHLAHALCTGVTTTTYALDRNVSLNTVYSHLKHIREKTGCKSVPELIRKFGELNVPLRPG
ncbi:MAG TPA: LuxR family transcriptional regulator [Pseudolabrys sp.]|nr:LuxR family transcriptional regulator [Pseudolabrys sp.]